MRIVKVHGLYSYVNIPTTSIVYGRLRNRVERGHFAKMASHESYYTSTTPVGTPFAPQTPGTPNAPPPPPPKPHDSSRASTPSVPQIPPHANANASQNQGYASPAPPQRPQPPMSPSGQSQYQYQSQYSQPPPNPQQQPQQSLFMSQAQIPLPALDSGWLPSNLKDYSTADLQPLLNQPELLDAFAKQHPAYSTALEPMHTALSANLALAQHVSQLEAQVKQLRDQTNQLLLNHTSLQTQWRRKQSEMDNALSPWGPRAMYSRLVSSINEQEAVLRAVHESFVEGGSDGHETYGGSNGKASEKEVTEWVRRIREGTTILEKRREMRQRWDENRVGGWR